MSEWLDNQKKQSSNFRKLLQERIEKANPRRQLTAVETKRLNKLEAIADKLKRGENVQNRQLQTCLSEDECQELEYEWQEQLELRSELKDKPSDLKRYDCNEFPFGKASEASSALRILCEKLRRVSESVNDEFF